MPWRKRAGSVALLSPPSSSPQQPRLTRQRKLRHLNDTYMEGVGGFLAALVPQPLPLPTDSVPKGSPNSGHQSLNEERKEAILTDEDSLTITKPPSDAISRRLGVDPADRRKHHKSQPKMDISVNVHPLPLPPSVRTESTPDWRKGKLIGGGTFGNVHVATNRHTGAICAMKEVNVIPDDPKSAECISQLQQEIKVLSQLKHRNIVQYYGSELVGDRFYIYLEYVYPGSINKYVRERCGAITESIVCNFTQHILQGLSYLHSKNTIHRDIKGANLLVDSSGVVKLADFGMAKHLRGDRIVNSLKGSPHWMAPEVVQSTMDKDLGYDQKVDIWSLGCTIIEMFTGQHPWHGFEGTQAMFQVLLKSPDIPEFLSPEGRDFLQCCFRRNPSERPTAGQLLDHPFIRGSRPLPHNPFSRLRYPDLTHIARDWIGLKGDPPAKGKQQHGEKSRLLWRRTGSRCPQLLVLF